MHRILVSSKQISKDKIIMLKGEQAHYIDDVLRLKSNEPVVAFDEAGNEYACSVEKSTGRITLRVKEKRTLLKNSKRMFLTVACAIPKKSRLDDIIDKLTQLGVDRIIPLKTKRVIIKLDSRKEDLRHGRWKRIAVSAAQQSQRNTLPIIEPIRNIREVLSSSGDFDLKLIPTLTGKRKTLKEVFIASKPKDVLVLIGPEGDFTDEEVALAKKSGFIPVSLGDLVLRVETAAVCVASFIRLYENG